MAENKMTEDKIKYMFMLYRAVCEDNKMRAVAMLFGKKLGESFKISCCGTIFLLKFTADGLWVFDDSWGNWNGEDGMLEALLRGEAVIIDVE